MPESASRPVLISIDVAEMILQGGGVLLLLVGAIALSARRQWRPALRLPPPRSSDLSGLDVLAGLYALFLVPALGFYLFEAIAGDAAAATSQPAGDAGSSAEARVLGQVLSGAVLVWLGVRRSLGGATGWGLRFDRPLRAAGLALLGYVAVWPVCAFVLEQTVHLILWVSPAYEIPRHDAIRTLARDDVSTWEFALTAISACILAPLVEEVFFRGILQPAVARRCRSPWCGIVVAGLAFGAIHYPNVHTIPALIVFGCVLGYIYAKSRSLTLAILVHAIFNAKTVLWLALGAPP